MFVLDDPGRLDDLLEAWEKAGVRGATIIESTGIHRRRSKTVPMRYMFQAIGNVEESHFTLFVIVENEAVVQACLQATEQLVGNLNEPNTGIFAAWPLSVVKGLSPTQENE
jgi:nitrogen regulatory protein PII